MDPRKISRQIVYEKMLNYPLSLTTTNDPRLWRLEEKPRKIYVGASIDAQLEAARLALKLQKAGFEVVSSWIWADHAALKEESRSDSRARLRIDESMGRQDLLDLLQADLLILLTETQSSSGGLHVEYGYFLGAGKPIIVVGRRPNVFYWQESVRFTPVVDGLVEWLGRSEHGESTAKRGEEINIKPYQPIHVPETPPIVTYREDNSTQNDCVIRGNTFTSVEGAAIDLDFPSQTPASLPPAVSKEEEETPF